MRNILIFSTLIAALVFFAVAPGFAAEGKSIVGINLQDASGTKVTLTAETKRIYASADRKGDDLLKTALDPLGQAVLDEQNALVISDISEAPGFVKRIIRSSLKDRKYQTLIDQSGTSKSVLPNRKKAVLVADLVDGVVVTTIYVRSAEELSQVLSGEAAIKVEK